MEIGQQQDENRRVIEYHQDGNRIAIQLYALGKRAIELCIKACRMQLFQIYECIFLFVIATRNDTKYAFFAPNGVKKYTERCIQTLNILTVVLQIP